MKGFIIALFVVITLGAGTGLVYWLQKPAFSEVPKFSSFAEPNPSVTEKAERSLILIPTFDPVAEIASTTYPLEELDQEIDYLVTLAPQRDPDQEVSFLELYEDASKISTKGGNLLTTVEESGRIYTKELIELLWNDIETIVARERLRFDVARPLQVDLRVNSPLQTPDTPSYPDELTAKLTILQTLFEELGYKDQTFDEAISIAVERTHIYGINTRLDIDYAKRLAEAYFEKVRMAHPTFSEFITRTKDLEWSGKSIPKRDDGYLPDVAIQKMNAEVADGGVIFTATVKNFGVASTPAEYPVLLEVDIYGDQKIDYREVFSARQLYSDQEDAVSYFLPITRNGEHLFRFTLDPDASLYESSYLNNLSPWQQLSIQ